MQRMVPPTCVFVNTWPYFLLYLFKKLPEQKGRARGAPVWPLLTPDKGNESSRPIFQKPSEIPRVGASMWILPDNQAAAPELGGGPGAVERAAAAWTEPGTGHALRVQHSTSSESGRVISAVIHAVHSPRVIALPIR